MPRFRSRYLTCFYCGTRSDTRFDGVTRHFTCKSCDATNYLDEKGEITDPPVATEQVASPPIATRPQRTTRANAAPPKPIFCNTCLKNQRLFVASIAQYLGDDDDDVKLDRDYYRFRRGLEKRYPQICRDCEAAASEAIHRAEYTAKTDHLRKMVAMSKRQVRDVYRRKTLLDWLHLAAQATWWAGLGLQLLWHLRILSGLLALSSDGMSDPDDTSMSTAAISGLKRGVSYLPDAEFLILVSLYASLITVWWNPKFVQVSRGFTKQLSGFKQWYLLQALLCVSRYFLISLDTGAQSRNAQLSAHFVMAGMALFVRESYFRDITTLLTSHRYIQKRGGVLKQI